MVQQPSRVFMALVPTDIGVPDAKLIWAWMPKHQWEASFCAEVSVTAGKIAVKTVKILISREVYILKNIWSKLILSFCSALMYFCKKSRPCPKP